MHGAASRMRGGRGKGRKRRKNAKSDLVRWEYLCREGGHHMRQSQGSILGMTALMPPGAVVYTQVSVQYRLGRTTWEVSKVGTAEASWSHKL